MRAMLRVVAK
jgi:hypothetical protein